MPNYRATREFFTCIETSGEILMKNFMLHESLTFTEIILYWIYIFQKKKIKFNVQILRSVDQHTTFSVNLEPVFTRHVESVYLVWLCLLSEIKILTSFWSMDSLECVKQSLVHLDLLQVVMSTPKTIESKRQVGKLNKFDILRRLWTEVSSGYNILQTCLFS